MSEYIIQQKMSEYRQMGFPNRILHELYQGLLHGHDVKPYATKDYNEFQMHSLRLAQDKGLDIKELLNPDLSHLQIDALTKGLEAGLDIKGIARPELSVANMKSEIESLLAMKKDGTEKPSLSTMIASAEQSKDATERKTEGNLVGLDIPHR